MCEKSVHNRITVPHIEAVGAADSLNHTLISLLTYIQQLRLVHTVLYSLFFWQPGTCGPCGSLIIFKAYSGAYAPGNTFGVSTFPRRTFSQTFPLCCLDIRMYERKHSALSQVSSWWTYKHMTDSKATVIRGIFLPGQLESLNYKMCQI